MNAKMNPSHPAQKKGEHSQSTKFVKAFCHSYSSSSKSSNGCDDILNQAHVGTTHGWMPVKQARNLGVEFV